MKKQYIIPIFVPHLGCPNDCIFCNQKSISGQKKNITKEDAKHTIEYFLKNVDGDSQIEIAFYGGSFTAIEEKLQEELLQVAYEYVKKGRQVAIDGAIANSRWTDKASGDEKESFFIRANTIKLLGSRNDVDNSAA